MEEINKRSKTEKTSDYSSLQYVGTESNSSSGISFEMTSMIVFDFGDETYISTEDYIWEDE